MFHLVKRGSFYREAGITRLKHSIEYAHGATIYTRGHESGELNMPGVTRDIVDVDRCCLRDFSRDSGTTRGGDPNRYTIYIRQDRAYIALECGFHVAN